MPDIISISNIFIQVANKQNEGTDYHTFNTYI